MKLLSLGRWAGPEWTAWYVIRRVLQRLTNRIAWRMMQIEAKRHLVGPYSVAAERNTTERNKELWDSYDWSRRGDEWTDDALQYKGQSPDQWKTSLVSTVLGRYLRGGTILEIGPGAGRWTQYLLAYAQELIVADIAPQCLTILRERFGGRLTYHLVRPERGMLTGIADASIDAIWSYDVFVHINPTDIDHYLREMKRTLKPGGVAVIHHVGKTPSPRDYALRFRSHMNAEFFAALVKRNGLELITQDWAAPHHPKDVISVFVRPTGGVTTPEEDAQAVRLEAPRPDGASPRGEVGVPSA